MIAQAPRSKIHPHKEILLLCARTRLEMAAIGRIRALLLEEKNFAEFLAATADHGIAPLVCHHLTTIASEELPPLWLDQLREEFRINSRRNLFLTAELFRVLDAFARNGIPAVPHKGPALAALAFGDIALRQFADLDLVLRHSEISAAHKILLDFGYRSEIQWQGAPDPRKVPGHYAYRSASGHINIELHTASTMRYLPKPLPLSALLPHLQSVRMSGREISTFAAEDALPLLCVHGAKHRWDQLSWIADISELVQSRKNFDWDRSDALARELGAKRMLDLGLAVAQQMLDTPLPAHLARRIERDAFVRKMSDQITAQFLNGERIRPGPVERFRTRVQMGGGALPGLQYGTRLVTAPTEDDWNRNRLPRVLTPLYAVLRPLRLFLEGDKKAEKIAHCSSGDSAPVFAESAVERMIELANVGPEDVVMDLTGLQGRAAIQAAKRHGVGGFGFEPTARDVAQAKIHARAAGVQNLVRFFEGVPQESNFAAATVILFGPSQAASFKLNQTLQESLLPGTRMVSYGETIADLPCVKHDAVTTSEGRSQPVYSWKPPLTKPKHPSTSKFALAGNRLNSNSITAEIPRETASGPQIAKSSARG